MRSGVVSMSQLFRTGRWDAGFNLDVAAMEDRLRRIGAGLESTCMDFREIASLVKESDEKSGSNRPSLRTIIFAPEMTVQDKVLAAATRLFRNPMLADYLPNGRLYDKWTMFFVSYAAEEVGKHLQEEEARLDTVRAVKERMVETLSQPKE